ncbi:hypothetical protein A2881_03685 [Candidatus Peribacteria bacterium RIFCSPHIGHO2_01_FULL_55_13]|nr:MAG: hypothetical protein A2881_03685 [Candidatus Peribacteria bacterium RIFCSPHIGHO2_01_FULL_55_13]OGJ64989.1 MAG: hypothetical protein A3F36_00035 [Candidatus Peribacteria bacterium RIFCSPHIGHO2_12_FULL_55_11]
MSAHVKRIGLLCAPVVALLFVWEIISRSAVINPLLFPPPSLVALALWELIRNGVLIVDAAVSLWRVLAGLSIGILLGVSTGLLTGRMQTLDSVMSPAINFLRPLPPVAIIPIVIVWLGIDDAAKIFSIALAVFFPVWLNTHIGAQRVVQEYLWSAELLTRSKFTIFSRVVLPAALPFIVAGVRTAISTAFIMVFVSELAGAQSGLGYRISITQLAYRVDQMMAGLVVLALFSALCDRVFTRTVLRLFPWLSLHQ